MTGIGRLAVAVLVAVVAVARPASPAGAHSGGRAQLYVDSVRLEPQPDGWRAALVLRDADSGKPEPGFGVQLTASGPNGQPVGPAHLADPDSDGRYAGAVPLTDGAWTLTVQAAEIPGGSEAIPFKKTWPIALQAGQSLDVGSPAPAARHQNGGIPAVPLVLGVIAAAVVLLRRRARRPAPKHGGPARRPAVRRP